MRDRPLPATPPTQHAPASTQPASGPNVNQSQALQLQQYRQRLQQMHVQLSGGQQQLKELQKNPVENQAKVKFFVSRQLECIWYVHVLVD